MSEKGSTIQSLIIAALLPLRGRTPCRSPPSAPVAPPSSLHHPGPGNLQMVPVGQPGGGWPFDCKIKCEWHFH